MQIIFSEILRKRENCSLLLFSVTISAVCIWEILSKGVKPFSNLTNAEAVEQIARGVRLERPDKCPHSLYEILLQCWNANPTLRPTFSMLKPRIR